MPKKIMVLLTILMTFCLFSEASALQVKSGEDSQTLLFRISAKEYSRIFVKNDRIVSVKGRNTAFETRQFTGTEDEGSVFIRPAVQDEKKPFSVFLSTESGRHFTLMLLASDIPAETIKIVPVSPVSAKAKHWETVTPYTQTLIDLVRAMRNNMHPEGYAVIDMGKTKPQRVTSALSLQLQTVFRGGFLQGEIWKLQNLSGNPVSVHPQNFRHGKVKAISLSSEKIPAMGSIFLYRIVSHE